MRYLRATVFTSKASEHNQSADFGWGPTRRLTTLKLATPSGVRTCGERIRNRKTRPRSATSENQNVGDQMKLTYPPRRWRGSSTAIKGTATRRIGQSFHSSSTQILRVTKLGRTLRIQSTLWSIEFESNSLRSMRKQKTTCARRKRRLSRPMRTEASSRAHLAMVSSKTWE